jgi:hypothetical protein
MTTAGSVAAASVALGGALLLVLLGLVVVVSMKVPIRRRGFFCP